jgi:hypothetical protein
LCAKAARVQWKGDHKGNWETFTHTTGEVTYKLIQRHTYMNHQLVKKYNRRAKNPLMLCHVKPLLFIEKKLYEIAAACKQAVQKPCFCFS